MPDKLKPKIVFYVGSEGSSYDDAVDAFRYATQMFEIKKRNIFVRIWRWIKRKYRTRRVTRWIN